MPIVQDLVMWSFLAISVSIYAKPSCLGIGKKCVLMFLWNCEMVGCSQENRRLEPAVKNDGYYDQEI